VRTRQPAATDLSLCLVKPTVGTLGSIFGFHELPAQHVKLLGDDHPLGLEPVHLDSIPLVLVGPELQLLSGGLAWERAEAVSTALSTTYRETTNTEAGTNAITQTSDGHGRRARSPHDTRRGHGRHDH